MPSFRIKAFFAVVSYLVAIGALLLFASGLQINPDNRVYYAETNAKYIDLSNFEQDFQTYSNVTYLLEYNEKLAPNVAEQLLWIEDRSYTIPGFIRSYSIKNYPHISSSENDIQVTTTLDAACASQGLACEFEGEEFYYLDEIKRRLISEDLSAVALVAVLDIGIGDHSAVSLAAAKIAEIKSEFAKQFPKTEISFTGTVPMMQAFVDASQRDLSLLLPISICLMLFLVFLATGSTYFALTLGVTCVGSIICTLSLAKVLDLTLNSATSILPLALLIISTSSSVHLLTFISRRFTENHRGKYRLLVQSAVHANRLPILLASLTTAFGFLTLCLVEVPPFREFGLLGAFGVAINYLTVVYIVPEFLVLRGRYENFRFQPTYNSAINSYAKLADARKLPEKGVLILSMLACTGLFATTIDENYVEFFDDSHEFRRGADRLNEVLSSPYHLDLVIDFGHEGSAFEPKNLQTTLDFQKSLNTLDEISNSLSFAQHVVRAKRSLSPGSERVIADESKDTIEQYYLAYLLSLQEGQSPAEFLDVSNQRLRISLLLTDLSSAELRNLELTIADIWANDYPAAGSLLITGEAVPLAHISVRSIFDMGIGLLASLLVLLVGAFVTTKNIKISLLTTLSVLAPFMMSFGLWSWSGAEFGLATSLIVAVTLGIIVDDTIHFVYRFLLGRNQLDLSDQAAIGYAIHHAGLGILSSSALLAAGFAVLMFSTFAVNSYFGVGVCISILCALIFSLLALPALLLRTSEHSAGNTTL